MFKQIKYYIIFHLFYLLYYFLQHLKPLKNKKAIQII